VYACRPLEEVQNFKFQTQLQLVEMMICAECIEKSFKKRSCNKCQDFGNYLKQGAGHLKMAILHQA
jgi:hypothetical protein